MLTRRRASLTAGSVVSAPPLASLPTATRTKRKSRKSVGTEENHQPQQQHQHQQEKAKAALKEKIVVTHPPGDVVATDPVDENVDEKENVRRTRTEEMELVVQAYQNTLNKLSATLNECRVSPKKAAPTPDSTRRRSMQSPQVTDQQHQQQQPIVMAPRTLLVPSNLPPTKLAPIHTGDDNADSSIAAPIPVPSPAAAASAAASAPASLDELPTPSPLTLAPVEDASRKIDRLHPLPAPYVTINPDMLRDAAWNFRDLQLLCMRLRLGGRGTRDQLVERLLAWHRKCFHKREDLEDDEDDHPLSIRKRMKYASNFSLLQFDTSAIMQQTAIADPTAAAAEPAPTTPPLSPPNDGHANGPLAHVTVSSSLPQLLTPLIYRTARKQDGTPRSIISPSMRPKSSAKRLSFSVFNGVKLIPSRQTSLELEMNSTPSPTKTLKMTEEEDEEDEYEEGEYREDDRSQECEEEFAPLPPEPQPSPNSSSVSFLSSVSSAIINALSPRKSAPNSTISSSNTSSYSSTFTFDRLPSIGDESELDSSLDQSASSDNMETEN